VNVLNRKLLRDIRGSKGLLLTITLIIAVGTGCFVGMLATYDNLETALVSYYARCRMADFWVDLKKAPETEVERLAEIPGISEVRTRISFPVVADLPGVDRPVSGLAVSLPTVHRAVINDIVLESGSYFTAGGREEVIVSKKFAEARGLRPGSDIHLVLNGQKKKLRVMGIAISSEHVYLAAPGSMMSEPGDYGVFYLDREFAEDVFGFHGACNNAVGILTPRSKSSGADGMVFEEVNRRLGPYGVFAVTPRRRQFSNLTLRAEMGGLKTTATALPLIFLSVAALVLNVLMTRLAEHQRVVVGTLKALGYGNRSLFGHFLKFGLVVGVGGGLAGCILGQAIADLMIGLYRTFFEFPDLTSRFYPCLISAALLISVTFAVLGTLRGVKRVVELSPAEAMHESMPEKGGRVFLERWGEFWKRLGFWWQIVLRTLLRNRMRTAIGVIAALLGSSLVLLAFGLSDSMTHMVDFQFEKVLLSDYNLTFKDPLDFGAVYEARALPGVNRVEPVFSFSGTFINGNRKKKGAITGLISGATLNIPRSADGTVVRVPPTGLLMSARLAEQLGVAAGEKVTFIPVRGTRRPRSLPVVSTVESMIGLSVYADYGYLNRLAGETASVTELQIKGLRNQEDQKDFFRQLKKLPRLQSLTVIAEVKEVLRRQMTGSMQAMTTIMILFAGVIFFGSILNGSLIAIAERRREIATFRVLGYRPSEIGGMFIRENLMMNMLGAILGLPFGYWMLKGLSRQYTNDIFMMPAVVSPSAWGWTVVLALVFVLVSHHFVQRAINRLRWQDALAMKE